MDRKNSEKDKRIKMSAQKKKTQAMPKMSARLIRDDVHNEGTVLTTRHDTNIQSVKQMLDNIKAKNILFPSLSRNK
jgi:hypothetical protein